MSMGMRPTLPAPTDSTSPTAGALANPTPSIGAVSLSMAAIQLARRHAPSSTSDLILTPRASKTGTQKIARCMPELIPPLVSFPPVGSKPPTRLPALGWDPLNATFLQARGNGGRSGGALGHGAQFDRSVTYRQNFGGASIRVMASLDDEVASDATGDDDHLTSASIRLPAGPIELIGAYLDASGYEGGPDDRDALKLGARYSEGAWSGALMHERRGEGLENGNFTFLSGSYKQGDWRFMANLGLFSDDNNANDGEYFALAARYELHNMVSVHGGVRQLDRDRTGKERVAGLGLRILLNSGNLLN